MYVMGRKSISIVCLVPSKNQDIFQFVTGKYLVISINIKTLTLMMTGRGFLFGF